MSLFLRAPFAATSLVAFTATLLSSCSSPSPATTATPAAAGGTTRPAPEFPFGGKVDSLNGIAGHPFGEPLSAFPKMNLLPPSPGERTRTYSYKGDAGWFGKHRAQVPTQLYYFLDGKFCRFLAIGNPTILREEVSYLFGPGLAEGKYRLFWEGSRARAAYVEQAEGLGMIGRLNVLSKPFEAQEAAEAAAQLQAENAQ